MTRARTDRWWDHNSETLSPLRLLAGIARAQLGGDPFSSHESAFELLDLVEDAGWHRKLTELLAGTSTKRPALVSVERTDPYGQHSHDLTAGLWAKLQIEDEMIARITLALRSNVVIEGPLY